ncbi:MAG: hypothetical protein KJ052_11040 [Candidatus Hydrogenedentes bacterium]|nr:hypothetical protein [Candidatus Hydrogenedentota bacterium]
MRTIFPICMIVLWGLVPAGCVTNRYVEELPPSETVAVPGFCFPFTYSGELTPWAATAIDQGIGARMERSGEPYPALRTGSIRREDPTARRQRIARVAADMIGGWDYILSTSDQVFNTARDLEVVLRQHRANPRYAESLAVLEVLYPDFHSLPYDVSLPR